MVPHTERALKFEDCRNNPRIKFAGIGNSEFVLRISFLERCNAKDLLLEPQERVLDGLSIRQLKGREVVRRVSIILPHLL